MNSLVLQTATRYLQPLLLLFSVFLLLEGHNEPGGGFTGGLVAASGFILYALAFTVAEARKALRFDPRSLIATGLCLAMGSALISVAAGKALMTGIWAEGLIPGLGKLAVGTPTFFDIGVYLVVVGVTLLFIFTLVEEVADGSVWSQTED